MVVNLLSRYIVKEHITPFIMALATLVFVLLANFLLRTMDKFLGKGLQISLLLEYVFLNLAWVLALAVPMAVLMATLMAYGRLSEDNEINAIRTSGINYRSLLYPALLFGFTITVLMTVFNNLVLPEMNHKARLLSGDISRKRPDLEFEVGYFIDALPGHTIFLGGRDGEQFTDITIFGREESQKLQRTIVAETGTIETIGDGVVLHLKDGVIHELSPKTEEYRQIGYTEYDVVIPVDNMDIQRRDSKVRGDREMTYTMIRDKIANYHTKITGVYDRMKNRIKNEIKWEQVEPVLLADVEARLHTYEEKLLDSLKTEGKVATTRVQRRIRNLKRGIQGDFKLIGTYEKYIGKYLVELHKKFSIPFASLIFILIGAPLGIMAKRGGFALSMALSLGFFVIYWGFLIAGEELADRGLLSPFLAMWQPNFVLGITGIILCVYTSREQHFLKLDWLNYLKNGIRKNDKSVQE